MDRMSEHGDEPTADDLTLVTDALRSAYLVAPTPEVEQRHLALMLAAASEQCGAVVIPIRHRRRGMVAAGIVAATLAGSMGLAAAGVLPAPLQNGVAAAVRPIGLHVPSSEDEGHRPGSGSPDATEPPATGGAGGSADAPGHGGTAPGRSEDAPGRGGVNPGKSDQAPGQADDPGRSAQAPGHGGENPGNPTGPGNVPPSTTPPTGPPVTTPPTRPPTTAPPTTPVTRPSPPTSVTPTSATPPTTQHATPTTPAPKSPPGRP